MRYRSVRFCILLLALTTAAFTHSVALAQCPGMCGDVNGSGTRTTGDVTAMFNWIYHQVPYAQPVECGDVDFHEKVTVFDASILLEVAMACDMGLTCSPPQPAWQPTPSDGYLVYYDDRFPAGDSQVIFDVTVLTRDDAVPQDVLPAEALTLPMLVDVSGDVPEIEVLLADPDSNFWWEASETQVQGGPPGHVLLGFLTSNFPPQTTRLASIRLTLPASVVDRSIHLQWTTLPPDNVPMAISGSCGFGQPLEPRLQACRVGETGDLQENGDVSSADIILLVNYVFKGADTPAPCAATGDVDCSGVVTSSDVIKLVNYVFKGGARPCNVCALVADGIWTCP